MAFRQYFRFCTFLFGTIKNNNSILAKKIEANISSTTTRNKYAEQACKKNLKKFSFISISLKLLNIFMAEHLVSTKPWFIQILFKIEYQFSVYKSWEHVYLIYNFYIYFVSYISYGFFWWKCLLSTFVILQTGIWFR